jgi:hypothetical protein
LRHILQRSNSRPRQIIEPGPSIVPTDDASSTAASTGAQSSSNATSTLDATSTICAAALHARNFYRSAYSIGERPLLGLRVARCLEPNSPLSR